MAPDLVQPRFTPQAPNQLLCGDITYIATDEGWLYLAAVIDMFSRQVLGCGAYSPTCKPAWSRMHWQWRGGVGGLSQELSFTVTGVATVDSTGRRNTKLSYRF